MSQAVYPHHEAGGRRQDHQHRQHDVDLRRALCAGLRRQQGGHRPAQPSLALAWAADNIQVNAMLPGWFETELTDGARAQVPGPVRARAGAHRRRPLGQARGHGRHRRLAGEPGVRLRHRHRHPGRRRLLDRGLEAQPICSSTSRTRSSAGSMSSRVDRAEAQHQALARRREVREDRRADRARRRRGAPASAAWPCRSAAAQSAAMWKPAVAGTRSNHGARSPSKRRRCARAARA